MHMHAPKMIPTIARIEIQGIAACAAAGKNGIANRMNP
jgi:hypothetical protein